MQEAGYTVQVFCLNAASMGVPQKRERVFFIGHKKEFLLPKLELAFNEEAILFGDFDEKNNGVRKEIISKYAFKKLENVTETGVLQVNKKSIGGRLGAVGFGYCVLPNAVPLTVTSHEIYYYSKKHNVSKSELCCIGTYPVDYDFKNIEPQYLIGMSVPPVMTAQISHQIYLQWLSKIKQ
jgi:DNA (cytosine-5)-methyltransferase 1